MFGDRGCPPREARPDSSETKKALRKKRQAIVYAKEAARGNGVHPLIDDRIAELDGEAEEIIARKANWIATPSGEVPHTTAPVLNYGANRIINTLTSHGETRIAEDASLARMDLLLQNALDCAPMALDAAETIKADNSLDKMLAHQMAAAHEASMRFLGRAMECTFPHQSVECQRYGSLSARFMTVFQEARLVLHRIRGGGQSITVQHVNVEPGGQAVVGNVRTGSSGGESNAEGSKQ
jgi:hypothetical protein